MLDRKDEARLTFQTALDPAAKTIGGAMRTQRTYAAGQLSVDLASLPDAGWCGHLLADAALRPSTGRSGA